MSEDLVKGEWTKSKFLDMLKEWPETIVKINDEKVNKLNEQLNSGEEVNLFKEDISKKKLISSAEFELNKEIMFGYDMGATEKYPVALISNDVEETQADVEELGYNAKNIIEKPKLKIGKTVWKGIKHFGKAFLKEGWNADITDFYDGIVKELSDFTMLVGETYRSDSRFRNNFDVLYSKIIGNSDEEYSKIINNILDNCITERAKQMSKTDATVKDYDSLMNKKMHKGNIVSSTSFNTSTEHKSIMTANNFVFTDYIKDRRKTDNIYEFNDNLTEFLTISNMNNIKKYNVIINFTDYLLNKWRSQDLFDQMKKEKKAVNYPDILKIFMLNINNIIKTEPTEYETRSIKTVLLFNKMKSEELEIDKALAFMLYTIYLAKANFDQNASTNKDIKKLDIRTLTNMKNDIEEMNKYLFDLSKEKKFNGYYVNTENWDSFIRKADVLIKEDEQLNTFLYNIVENKYNTKELANEYIRFITNNKKINKYKKDEYVTEQYTSAKVKEK